MRPGPLGMPSLSCRHQVLQRSLRQFASWRSRWLACILKLRESSGQGVSEGNALQVVEVVAEQCRIHKVSTLVVDPVLVSTSGHSLGDSDVAAALKERLADFPDMLPLASVAVRFCVFAVCCLMRLSGRKPGLGVGFCNWRVLQCVLSSRSSLHAGCSHWRLSSRPTLQRPLRCLTPARSAA